MSIGCPITMQRIDDDGQWVDVMRLHCLKVNQTASGEHFEAGAEHAAPSLTFEVRWSKKLESIRYETPQLRILYRKRPFAIQEYDDYQERRSVIKLKGVSHGV